MNSTLDDLPVYEKTFAVCALLFASSDIEAIAAFLPSEQQIQLLEIANSLKAVSRLEKVHFLVEKLKELLTLSDEQRKRHEIF